MSAGDRIGTYVHLCRVNVLFLRVGVSTYVHVCGRMSACVRVCVCLSG